RDALATATDACGRVSTTGAPPRVSENVYRARIYDIDGTGTPLGRTHELQAGTHVLLVEEGIDRHRFDPMQAERRDRTRTRTASGAPACPGGRTPDRRAGPPVPVAADGIERHRFAPMPAERRARPRPRLGPRAAKALVIEVAADTRYQVGARLLPDRLDAAGIHSNSYWEPVVWEVTPEPCRR